MTETPTIEELEDLVDGYANACFMGSGDAEDYRADILSAYTAQAARIAELEAMLVRLQWCHEGMCPVCGGLHQFGHVECELHELLPKEATNE